MNCPVIQIELHQSSNLDIYGFVKNVIANSPFSDFPEIKEKVLEILSNGYTLKNFINAKLREYDAFLNMSEEGHDGRYISERLEKIFITGTN